MSSLLYKVEMIDLTISDYRGRLQAMLPLAEARAARLSGLALEFEDRTPNPTEADEAHLDRLILISRKAQERAERILIRLKLMGQILSNLEDERDLRRRR